MELLSRYDYGAGATPVGWGLHGARAAARLERARSVRRPATAVLMDVRARTGARGRSGTRGGGTSGDGGTYQAGLFGEEVVADRLVSHGWRLLGHRVRTRVGELDLVARRGDTIVFAEVKTAHAGRMGVEESVDARQRLRVRRAAVSWMADNPGLQRGVRRYRFDVFIVRLDDGDAVERIEQIKDAF
ncbi:MAG: YraN family protein [Thermoleophilia bacterium]|nr:YraN family protein [Thermoleophilia bacterium]